MERFEELIIDIENTALSDAPAYEVRALKQRMPFGLAFERHRCPAVRCGRGGSRPGLCERYRRTQGQLRMLQSAGDEGTYVNEIVFRATRVRRSRSSSTARRFHATTSTGAPTRSDVTRTQAPLVNAWQPPAASVLRTEGGSA